MTPTRTTPQPLTFEPDEPEVRDLRQRLGDVRWSRELQSPSFARNYEPGYLRETLRYWRDDYDWFDRQALLNEPEHFQVTLDDQTLHYVRFPGPSDDSFPLLLLHGWPSSFVEFMDLGRRLVDPGDCPGPAPGSQSFDVIIPSLPGYGFSRPLSRSDIGMAQIADWFHRLMTRVLGHESYGVFGGDWGAVVASRIGYAYPKSVEGIYLSMIGVAPHPESRTNLSEAEKGWLEEMDDWQTNEAGYQSIQRTNPHPLGVSLDNSPAGLCAWILDKYCAWSEAPPGPQGGISRDQFLDNLSVYWFTQTIASSIWLYRVHGTDPWQLDPGEQIPVPAGVTLFPHDIPGPPREWVDRVMDIRAWNNAETGGHFPALETPDRLRSDLRTFFGEIL